MFDFLPIETERVRVRQFYVDDAFSFHSWRDNPDVARYTLWEYPYSMEEAEAFCAEQAGYRTFPVGGWCQLLVEERALGKAIGDVGLGIHVAGEDSLTLGYSLHPNYWGKGYMYEALSRLIPSLHKALSLKCIKATIDARNPASGKLLERLGFEAGPLVKQAAFVKGEWCDEYDYELSL